MKMKLLKSWERKGRVTDERENAVIDSLKETVSVEEYEMVVCPTQRNDERRSRKPHQMEAQVGLVLSRECVGYDGYTLGKRERLDD